MNYCSKIKVESQLKDAAGELLYPAVSWTLSKMNERRRVKREMTIADLRMRLNEQREGLDKALEAPDDQPRGTIDKLNAAFGELLHGEWYPAWLRWGVASIEGFDIDGVPATVATLCEAGPTNLIEEIFLSVLKEAGLSAPERKNLNPPGDSGAPEDGATDSSIATIAAPPDGTESATAPSTSPAT